MDEWYRSKKVPMQNLLKRDRDHNRECCVCSKNKRSVDNNNWIRQIHSILQERNNFKAYMELLVNHRAGIQKSYLDA